MFSFRQKIFLSYALVFIIFIILMFPLISQSVHHLVIHTMETRASEVIANIKDAPNNEALVRRLKDQKSLVFFRISVISNEHKVLYDSHIKRLLGPKFSQEFIVEHPEVLEAFKTGVGYHEEYSKLLDQKFSYFAKSFDFHGRTYVLRTAFPHNYISQLVNDFKLGFLAFATLILLLFSAMTWFIIHNLSKPIHRIIKAIRPYQEGVQTVLPAIDIGSNPDDEFAKLASTLNTLSTKIQSHIDTLTDERNEKEAILESLVEGVVAVDENMLITYVNNMTSKLIPIQHHMVGQNFIITGQDQCFALLKQCQEENIPLVGTIEQYIDGQKVYLDIVAAPKKDNGGAILVLQDKTAHYKIFEMRRDFIANASHELKTPITVIRGFAEALHDNPDLPRETQEEITSKIMRNCQRMTALIKDLLTLADIENIPSSRLIDCDVHDLIQHCSHMLLEVFPDTQIQINKPTDQDVLLIADADLLELALMNLIENAAKYSVRPAKIQISLEQNDKEVKISIADQGIGIPKTDQEHIFERFYTVDKARSQKMGGSGLGLSIVKTIVEKHFGTIQLVSEIGQGSTFIIRMPKRDESEIV